MKIPIEVTIDIGQYENIKPKFEIDVPDGLKDEELVMWLWQKYHKLTERIPTQSVRIHSESEEIHD